jgi:protein SCO1/2
MPFAPDRSPQARAERMRRHFPNVALRTHDGRAVRFYDDLVKGRKVIINFTYLNCTSTCPRTTENLRRVCGRSSAPGSAATSSSCR